MAVTHENAGKVSLSWAQFSGTRCDNLPKVVGLADVLTKLSNVGVPLTVPVYLTSTVTPCSNAVASLLATIPGGNPCPVSC